MKKKILSVGLLLALCLSFSTGAFAETKKEQSINFAVTGDPYGKMLGTSRIEYLNGTYYALGATTYIGASSNKVTVDGDTDAGYNPNPQTKTEAKNSVSLMVALGTDYNTLYTVYSTHVTYRNGVQASIGNTGTHW